MSITFSPAGNMSYCDANGLTGATEYECQCVDFPEMFSDAHPCIYCDKGKVRIPNYPFEANLSNGNAYDVLRMFGIEADYSGSVNPQTILDGIEFVRSLNNCGHEPLVTATTEETGKKGCRVIHCGRDPEQIERYLVKFHEIAMEAARRKVEVVWG